MSSTQRAPDIMDLELLTPGSVWVRKSGQQSRYLFTTNTNLPVELQKAHPQMAVYADENDNLYSVPVVAFMEKRTFHNVDPGLESRVANLMAFDVSDSTEDTFDLLNDADDTLIIEDSEELPSADNTPPPLDAAYPVKFFAEGTGLPEIISPFTLSKMTECYQQQPMIGEGKLLHTLFIHASDEITNDKLYACFSPTHAELNAVYTFKVHTPDGLLDIDWDTLLGIYPYIFQKEPMFQVIFSSGTDLTYEVAEVEPEVVFAAFAEEDGTVIISASAPTVEEIEMPAPAFLEMPVVIPSTEQAKITSDDFVVSAG